MIAVAVEQTSCQLSSGRASLLRHRPHRAAHTLGERLPKNKIPAVIFYCYEIYREDFCRVLSFHRI